MIPVDRTWAEMKSTIDNESVYFYFVDRVRKNERMVTLQPYRGSLFVCYLLVGTSEYTDFDTNYKDRAGEKTYLKNSWQYTAIKNSTTPAHFQLKDVAGNPVESFLFQGKIIVGVNAVFDDYFMLEMVDKDGIYYPAGTVLATMIQKEYVEGGKQSIVIKPPNINPWGNRKKIPSWAWAKFTYVSTGLVNDVKLKMVAEYEFK